MDFEHDIPLIRTWSLQQQSLRIALEFQYSGDHGACMKASITTIAFGLLVSIALGQVNSGLPEKPSSLEALARQPEARVTWFKEVGQLESGDSHAVFTTLAVEDSAQRGRRMRGVRIDLSRPDWKRIVYIDEGLLQPLKKIFDQLTLDIERGLMPARGTGWGFIGSCEFRNNPDVYPLEADFCYSGPDSPALRVFGPNREQIMFPGLMPSSLSKVLGSAIDELKER